MRTLGDTRDHRGTEMIEKGIPIPPNYKKELPNNGIYPWRRCEQVGDSFAIRRTLKKVQAAAKRFTYRNKEFKFHIEQCDGYCRVWRVE